VGANYREANETDTKRDFLHKLRLAKKEAKETIYWLRLLLDFNQSNDSEIEFLLNESKEIMLILGSIYQSTKKAGSK
jgi:four helix bundle protein